MNAPYPWLQAIWKTIETQTESARKPHAILLTGAKGLGKYSLAESIAEKMLGAQFANHPDFKLLQPEEPGKNIKIDQVRELLHWVTQTSHQAGYQIVIIHPAEAMNRAAANALLRTLEEPSGQVMFILVNHRLSALLPTIRSRCQIINVANTDHDVAKRWLIEQSSINDQQAETLLRVSNNAPLAAQQLFTEKFLDLYQQCLLDLIQLKQHQIDPSTMAKQYLKLDALLVMQCFMQLLMDLIRLKQGLASDWLTATQCQQQLTSLATHYQVEQLFQLLQHVRRINRLLLSSASINVQLQLEGILCQC